MKINGTHAGSNAEMRILMLCPVRVYRTACLALLDMGSSLKLISAHLLCNVKLELTSIKRTIIEENDVNEGCKGFINEVAVLFFEEVAKMHLRVVDGVTVDILIRLTNLEPVQANIDYGGQFSTSKSIGS